MYCPRCKSADIALEAEARVEDWLRCQACGFVWAMAHKPDEESFAPDKPHARSDQPPDHPAPPRQLDDDNATLPHNPAGSS
jgi:hypothetical protein